LAQVPRPERLDKLQQTFKSVEDDYLRIMGLGRNGHNGEMESDWEDEEEEEEEEDDDVGEQEGEDSGRPAKRLRRE
jgi:hypothetical protein